MLPALSVSADNHWKDLMPEGEGKALTAQQCSICHTLQKVVASRKSLKEWERSVYDMTARGAQIFPDEAEAIIKYLTKNFGPDKPPAN
jgi:mono/diheme cytochrome c family protein